MRACSLFIIMTVLECVVYKKVVTSHEFIWCISDRCYYVSQFEVYRLVLNDTHTYCAISTADLFV